MPRSSNYHSSHLTRSQVNAAIHADAFAQSLSAPLNLVLHIHWYWTGYAQCDRRKALAKLFESQRHWLVHRGLDFYSIAVRENPGLAGIGEHAHQLVHVPQYLRKAFLAHVRNFLRNNQKARPKGLKWAIGYSGGKLAYLCKGATRPARQAIMDNLGSNYEKQKFVEATEGKSNQGVIWGKRLYISRALGRAAQALYQAKLRKLAA